jgi:hypothetical protein
MTTMADENVSRISGLMERMNPFDGLSLGDAARVAGVAIILMFITAYVVGDVLLENLIVPGDSDQLAEDIEADWTRFGHAVVGYLVLLLVDAVIALSLYVVLRPVSRDLASLAAILRLLYVIISLMNLAALATRVVDTHSYGTVKLVAYLVFILHLVSLGYVVYISGYIPRALGVLLFIAALSYVPAFFLGSLVPEDVKMVFALPMMIGEFALGIWLLGRARRLPGMTEGAGTSP